MVIAVVSFLALFSLFIDCVLWRALRCRFSQRQWVAQLYIASCGVIYLPMLFIMLSYGRLLGSDEVVMRAMLWVYFLFFVTAVPKMILAFSLGVRQLFCGVSRRGAWIVRMGGVVALAMMAVMTWGATVGRTRIVMRNLTVSSPKIPASFDGYRIVMFTDLHTGNLPANGKMLTRLADRINALRPDLVVCGGDLINVRSEELTPDVIGRLSRIDARDGVVSVLGNHDLGIYMSRRSRMTPKQCAERVIRTERMMGWTVLDNQTCYLRRGDDSVAVSGVGFPASSHTRGNWKADFSRCDFRSAWNGVPDTLFNLLLMHSPEMWDMAHAGRHADLTLSGHVHSMQFKFKIGRWKWSPAQWIYRHWSGLSCEGDKNLYINDGIGYVLYPMRIGTPPELTLITLRRGPASAEEVE